jgi:hypothetical protein
MMSNATKLTEQGAELAKSFYNANPDDQAPTIIYGVKNDEIVFSMRLIITDQLTKTLSLAAANQMLKEQECDASIATFEAWMASGWDGRPSECPNRIEVLTVVVSTLDHYSSVAFRMARNNKGQLTHFVEHCRDEGPQSDCLIHSRFNFFGAGGSQRRMPAHTGAKTKH